MNRRDWERIAIGAGLAVLAISMIWPALGQLAPVRAPVVTEAGIGSQVQDEAASVVVVHVAGAVMSPGVYVLDDRSRVADAIAMAGGATESADLDRINLAAVMTDGQRVLVPVRGGGGDGGDGGGRVNVNTASQRELETLPGIGPALASRIIGYREQNGSFGSIDDLTRVSGIGAALVDRLREIVEVD